MIQYPTNPVPLFAVPPPKFYVQLNPIQVYFDVLSVLWANSFALNLHQSLQKSMQDVNSSLPYVDVKIEAVMPRVRLCPFSICRSDL